jgi:hypothetical protein
MVTPERLARLAGALNLLMCILGGAAQLGVRAGVRVPGDAAATLDDLVTDPTRFRLALVADIAMATIFVFVGITLYLLFRHVDRHAAGALLTFVAVGARMILTNLLLHQATLLVATDPTHHAFGSDGLVLLLLDLHGHGYALAGVFFGLWLLPLGYSATDRGCSPGCSASCWSSLRQLDPRHPRRLVVPRPSRPRPHHHHRTHHRGVLARRLPAHQGRPHARPRPPP